VPLPPAAPPPLARSSTSGVIQGRVLRADGIPLRRARVQLESVAHLFAPSVALTDDDGRYEFRNLRPGSYLLSAATFGSAPVVLGQRSASDRGEVITLEPAAGIDHLDIALPRSSVIGGRIVDENGDPIASVNVRVQQVRFAKGRRRLVSVNGIAPRQTDDLGRYRIFGLQPGRYLIDANGGQPFPAGQKPDIPGYARTYYPGTPSPAEAQAIEVNAGEDALNVDVALVRGRIARIAGTAYDASGNPLDGAVRLSPSFRSGAIATPLFPVRTNPNGTFEFANLTPGEYVLQASMARSDSSTEGAFVAQFVTVNETDVSGVILRMAAGSTIAGRVTVDGAEQPDFEDFELSPVTADLDLVSLADNPPARAEFHDDGSFEMHGVSGPRRLQLVHAPEGWALKSVRVNGADVTDTPLVFGTPEQSLRGVEVELMHRAVEVTGRVTDARGHAFTDAVVAAFATDRARWYEHSRFLAHATPDRDARFSLRGLAPGEYYVAAIDRRQAADVESELVNPEFLESVIADATRVTLAEGKTASLTLRLGAR
jgi:protocatechuate 3,4-dioxygenase beta subunit